jgi:hypothetical protein
MRCQRLAERGDTQNPNITRSAEQNAFTPPGEGISTTVGLITSVYPQILHRVGHRTDLEPGESVGRSHTLLSLLAGTFAYIGSHQSFSRPVKAMHPKKSMYTNMQTNDNMDKFLPVPVNTDLFLSSVIL